jgi:glycosidase
MTNPRYPALYQINTRVRLNEIGARLGRPATLDDITDDELDEIARLGFDCAWLLGVWQTGDEARQVSRANAGWRREFEDTLPDLKDDDICGSCFAVTGYTVRESMGGDAALARVRERLRQRGLRLMLDFVPNHTAPDHPWVKAHPDYYIIRGEAELQREPHNYRRVTLADGQSVVMAYGRDPYFDGWPDTLQLNYSNPALQEAMTQELLKIAGQCDGVRCDMAMLVLPDVFQRTWGIAAPPFWSNAIQRVRAQHPAFTFMAEVYWDLEWTIQQQGFDYAYDKRLYDRLREGHARPVRDHLRAGLDYQDKLARFLENHDEPRAAATFSFDMHRPAAVVTFFTPGLRFFHQGQLHGRRKRISMHLCRGPVEPTDIDLHSFYEEVLACLKHPAVRDGEWQLLECAPAWDGNWTADCFVAFAWRGEGGYRLLVAVNYAPNQSQCYVQMAVDEWRGKMWQLRDLMSEVSYRREGDDLASRGLYLDVPPWGYHLFELTAT